MGIAACEMKQKEREINLEWAKNKKKRKKRKKKKTEKAPHHPWLSSFGAWSTSIGVVESSFALSAAPDSGA